ncbi:hypothetical protein JYT31_00820 [Beggiatoa alba]|nr:hypothetical protein [Beggiatoa alba]
MNKKILISIVIVSVAWFLILPSLSRYTFVYFESADFYLLEASNYLALGAIVFVAVYSLRKWPEKPGQVNSESDEPILPARILSLIVLLAALIYPAFFIDKGYFSNSLISFMDVLGIKQLNLKSEITTNEKTVSQVLIKLKNLEKSKSTNGDLLSKLENKLNLAQRKLKSNQRKSRLNDQRHANLKNRLTALQEANHFENLYYVMRALCLGALGAILTLLATSSIKSKKISTYKSLFNETNYWQSLISNCLAGSIVSVVAFALFYTKQISIFDSSLESGAHSPDFWRSTLLCLIAGAFAEKIYEAVSTKVDDYVDNSGNGSNKAIQPTPKSGAADG